MKVGVVSLGCPKNLVDTERLLGLLGRAGHIITPHAEEADLLLVNTCAFIQSAQEESIEAILEMARHKEDGRCKALVVFGCLPQRFGPELAAQLPEVDAWAGANQVAKAFEACKAALAKDGGSDRQPFTSWGADPAEPFPRLLCTPSHYAYLKIAEGCRNHCAYCVIPSLRGDLRSQPLPVLLAEAEELAEKGVQELILVAQDLGNYGRDLNPQVPLVKLLEGLCRIEGLEWIRLLYMHPAHVPEELSLAMASEPKICPYLDLPLQHIDDQILKGMHRGVTSDQIRRLIEGLRSSIPQLSLRTTVLVGFPGEGEAEFSALLDFIGEAKFDHLGAFAYSREEGTPAARMKAQVPQGVKAGRVQQVMEAQAAISWEKNRALVGSRQRVLIDEWTFPERSIGKGRTSRQAPEIDGAVYVKNSKEARGEWAEVKIIEADTYDLVGECLV